MRPLLNIIISSEINTYEIVIKDQNFDWAMIKEPFLKLFTVAWYGPTYHDVSLP